MSKESQSTLFVLFGGMGDLSWRKLVPSLFSLFVEKKLPKSSVILIVGRTAEQPNSLSHLQEGVKNFSRYKKVVDEHWDQFATHLKFLNGDINQDDLYNELKEFSKELSKDGSSLQRIYYMATPPSSFGIIASKLGDAGLADDRKNDRLVIEKPIGYDLPSAKTLDKSIAKYFQEQQVFRIDHYLGKENVQNMLVFRFANPMFEPIWNRSYIKQVAITVSEQEGVGTRAGYYDHAGALKDMIQNHLMQLLCLVAMEPPMSLATDEIRNKKIDVLRAVRKINTGEIDQVAVRGQYEAYRQEPGVDPHSTTETYAALRLFIDNWRWQGVPFYLRTGKALSKRYSEINIQFCKVPHKIFPASAGADCQPSQLIINIQPNEGIILTVQAKKPGSEIALKTVNMNFRYQESFKKPSPEAYETLLVDILRGEQTLFMRVDQVEASWAILMPIIEYWQKHAPNDFPNYAQGSEGPAAAEELIESEGGAWPQCMAFDIE